MPGSTRQRTSSPRLRHFKLFRRETTNYCAGTFESTLSTVTADLRCIQCHVNHKTLDTPKISCQTCFFFLPYFFMGNSQKPREKPSKELCERKLKRGCVELPFFRNGVDGRVILQTIFFIPPLKLGSLGQAERLPFCLPVAELFN